MSELLIGFIVAAILLIAEYLLCTKLESPLWGGIIPALILVGTICLLPVVGFPWKRDICSHSSF